VTALVLDAGAFNAVDNDDRSMIARLRVAQLPPVGGVHPSAKIMSNSHNGAPFARVDPPRVQLPKTSRGTGP
jgi:hypothetical protein